MSPADRLRRSMAAAAVAVAVVAAPLPLSAPARAATGEVRLLSQTAWVHPGTEFVLRLAVDAATPQDLELSVSVHQAVQTRTQFHQTVAGRVRGSPIQATSAPLSELERDAAGAVRVVLPVHDTSAGTRDRLILRRPGVYPVRIELRDVGGGDVADRITTHLVYVPPSIDGPRLAVTPVIPVHAPPGRQPDGSQRLPRQVAADIAGVARALLEAEGVPAVIDPTPETLAALAAGPDADVLDLLRRAAADRQVMSGAFVPITPIAFAGELQQELAAQRSYGTEVVRRLLHPQPSTDTAVLDGAAGDATVTQLRDQQVENLLVPESALVPIPLVVTLAQPFQLRGRQARQVNAAAADAALAAHAASGEDAVLGAHHLLADLAVIYFDSPGRVRGVVASIPRSWDPDPQFVHTALGGLASSPILDPVDLETFFSTVPAATGERRQPLVRDLEPAAAAASLPVDRILDARRRLVAFSSIPEPGTPVTRELEERLLVAESADLRPRMRAEYLDGFDRAVAGQLDALHIPRSRSVTLTARQGDIPVTVRNDLGYPARVVLQLISDKLEFPEGRRIELDLGRRNTTRRVEVRARTSGSFPLRVVLLSPDGGLVLAESRFTIRSTAASGVGVVLSIGAVWFLLMWWLRHVVRNRRSRRVAPVG